MKNKLLLYVGLGMLALILAGAAGVGISTWTAVSESIVDADLYPITDVSDTTQSDNGSSKKATHAQLTSYLETKFYTEGEIDTALGLKANLASPTFTGTVTTPTLVVTTSADLPATIDFPADSVDYADLSFALSKDIVVEDPADADSWLIFKAPYALTITDIHCIATAGTSVVIDVQECTAAGASCTTVDATITCDTDGAEDDGTFTNGAIDAGDWVKLDIGTVTGTVTGLAVSIYY